jgi:hypothetical protein
MDARGWMQNALDELNELTATPLDSPGDAWRASVLVARLLGSPLGPTPPRSLVARLPSLVALAGLPDHQLLLHVVARELESTEDAWGPLLDALLDVDDAATVHSVAGDRALALDLAAKVAALVSLYPERSLPLGAFAEMRMETVRNDSTVGEMWRAVELAPAYALVDALPIPEMFEVKDTAHLAVGRPWLQAAFAWLRRSSERFARAAAGISDSVSSIGAEPDFAASLGAADSLVVDLIWGEIHRIDLALSATVRFSAPANSQLWYLTSSMDGELRGHDWKLEPGESPVLVVATDSSDATSLNDAVERGHRLAALILVEETSADDVQTG